MLSRALYPQKVGLAIDYSEICSIEVGEPRLSRMGHQAIRSVKRTNDVKLHHISSRTCAFVMRRGLPKLYNLWSRHAMIRQDPPTNFRDAIVAPSIAHWNLPLCCNHLPPRRTARVGCVHAPWSPLVQSGSLQLVMRSTRPSITVAQGCQGANPAGVVMSGTTGGCRSGEW